MVSESSWRIFLGSFALLAFSYLIYLIRYPMWRFFTSVEPIFAMLMLSYFLVLLLALFLLKRDVHRSLLGFFKTGSHLTILIGVVFALVFQGLWFLTSYLVGSRFESTSFLSLRGYENYAVYSPALGFVLYLAFAVFGAFAEEVAYRGYVQSRISSRYGYVVGIVVATLLFSLQHIHIFQLTWIEGFFQTQFVHVLLFGIFVGYLFVKSKEDIRSAFSFHALSNVFNVSLPIIVTPVFPSANQFADIASFVLIMLLLHYLL